MDMHSVVVLAPSSEFDLCPFHTAPVTPKLSDNNYLYVEDVSGLAWLAVYVTMRIPGWGFPTL